MMGVIGGEQRGEVTGPLLCPSCERGAPFSTEGFARLLQRAAATAGLDIKVHAHMLRAARLSEWRKRYDASA